TGFAGDARELGLGGEMAGFGKATSPSMAWLKLPLWGILKALRKQGRHRLPAATESERDAVGGSAPSQPRRGDGVRQVQRRNQPRHGCGSGSRRAIRGRSGERSQVGKRSRKL